jgi:hypothetical protein
MGEPMQPMEGGDELAADLRSEDPARVRRALETLDHAWKQGRFAKVPMPGPECLDAFGDDVPATVIAHYLSVLENYPAFSPSGSPSDIRHAMLESVIRQGHGDWQLVHTVALHLRTEFQPESAASDALDWVGRCGLDPALVSLTARRLVDLLLDDSGTRAATVAAMRSWAELGELPDVIEAARPRLDEAERAQLVVDNDD